MKFDFIQVNKSILDYSEYVRSVILLKNYLKHRLIELLLEEGFKLESDRCSSYSELEAVFHNQEKDLCVKIIVSKREEEHFV